jgi:TIR domain
MSNPAPGVFLAHATDDNDRFARGLAYALNDRGLHVWFDEWELAIGDSIVDRIFEEGVPNADAMVVVVSEASVKSRWVHEEMNAGFVRKIEGRFKLLPVIIDDVDVPGVLKTTFYRRVEDLQNTDLVADEIVRAVLGQRDRPDPGELPAYARAIPIVGLDRVDTVVLRAAGDLAVETNQTLLDTREVLGRVAPDGVSEDALLDTLEILGNRGYLEITFTLARGIEGMSSFSLTDRGVEEYANAFVPDYGDLQDRIVRDLASSPRDRVHYVVDSVLEEHVVDLEMRGLVRTTKVTGEKSGVTSVDWVNPELRRLAD